MRRRADDKRGEPVQYPSMLTGSPPDRDRRAVRMALLALGAAVVFAAGAFAVSVAGGDEVENGSPQDTVRDFLVTSVVDGDGVDACGFLTPGAARSLRAVEPRDVTCHEALARTRLTLGGEHVDDEAEVKGLDYRVTQHGGRARVTVSVDGAAMTFTLRRANDAEDGVAGVPPTPWRIDSRVDQLVEL